MTFPDKTMYPVSSKNEQDFINLTKVYLDAVFRPAIYHNDSIFRQEGWHYEVEDEEPFYNGVVFNEMKGSFASVDTIIEEGLMRELYPDNTYKYVSGGHPAHIPDLTYDNFLRAHREFYSPSNCRFYLDGDLPLERVLEIIDEEYLSTIEPDDHVHEIPMQEPVPSKELTEFWNIPVADFEEFRRFCIARAGFALTCAGAIAVSGASAFFLEPSIASLVITPAALLVATGLSYLMIVTGRPGDRKSIFGTRYFMSETMIGAAFVILPFVNLLPEKPSLTTAVTVFIFAVCGDILVTGLLAVIRRRLIFVSKSKYVDGLPFYLILISCVIMIFETAIYHIPGLL
jgi:hypothetical protein